MQAIVLAGGLGTRLRDRFPDGPKALVPVAGKPMLARLLNWLREGGVEDVHLATGHMAEAIVSWLEEHPAPGLDVTVTEEPRPMGTGGALKYAAAHIRGDTFFLLNGDSILPNLDLRDLMVAHHAGGHMATIAVTKVDDASRFGTVDFDERNKVTAFREKAAQHAGWISGGAYALSREVLDHIEPGQPQSIEHDLFPTLVTEHEVRVFTVSPPLLDMGTPEGLAAMESFFLST